MTGGLAGMAKARKVEVVRGVEFLVRITSKCRSRAKRAEVSGAKKVVRFQKAIIAAGAGR